jgi:hypothetical protein
VGARPFVIVADEADQLATQVARRWRATVRRSLVVVRPHELADARLTVDAARVLLDGARVTRLWVRARPEQVVAPSFRRADRSFVETELRATVIGALHAPTVRTLQRWPVDAWFDGLSWLALLRQLGELPLRRYRLGGAACASREWLPAQLHGLGVDPRPRFIRYLAGPTRRRSPTASSTFLWGRRVSGVASASARAAAARLASLDVGLVSVSTAGADEIVAIDPIPHRDGDERLAERVAGWFQ